MANPSYGVLLLASYLFFFLSGLIISSSAVTASGGHELSWFPGGTGPACRGTVADCMASDEYYMDSEINRRILQTTTQYISYGALQRNTVPCSQRGQSYYNCVPGQANPYTRGCSAITRCRS